MDYAAIFMELVNGQAVTQQLNAHLDGTALSADQCKSMVQSILSSWEKLASMAKPNGTFTSQDSQLTPGVHVKPSSSVTHNPRKCISKKTCENPSKKRRMLPTWKSQPTNTDLDTNDAYSWRKYGQKNILGSRNPRSYYRCSHRFSQGCQAFKMMQRSDDDPSLVNVAYKGEHTCGSKQHKAGPSVLETLKRELKVDTEGLDGLSEMQSATNGGELSLALVTSVMPEILGINWEVEDFMLGPSSYNEGPGDAELFFRFEDSPDLESIFSSMEF